MVELDHNANFRRKVAAWPDKFDAELNYIIRGAVLNTIWRMCYLRLIEEGYPLRGDDRRDIAQLLGAQLNNAIVKGKI